MAIHEHGDVDQANDHGGGTVRATPGGPERGPGSETSECRDALERLYSYLDGELTEVRRAAIRAHLDECSPCLEAFDFEAELKLVVARHCRDSVPEQLRARVAMVISRAAQEAPPSQG